MNKLEFKSKNVSKLATQKLGSGIKCGEVVIHLICAESQKSDEDVSFYHEIILDGKLPQNDEIGFLVLHDINTFGVCFSLKPPKGNRYKITKHLIPWHKISHVDMIMEANTYSEIHCN